MKDKKGWNYLATIPLLIFVVSFIVGMAKFDVKDSISLDYIYFGFIPLVAGYLVSIGLSLGTIVASFKNLYGKSLKQQIIFFSFTVSWLLLLFSTFIGKATILFPYIMLANPAVLSFGICTILLAIFGWQIDTNSAMDTISPNNRIKKSSIFIGACIPLILTFSISGIAVSANKQNNVQVKTEYTQVIKEKLEAVGTTGKVKVLQFSNAKKNTVNIDFTLQQENVVVYGKAVLGKNGKKWEMKKSTITTYQNSLEAFLQVPIKTKEANEFIESYKAEVNKSIEKNNLENKLSVPKENKNNEDEKSIPSYRYLSGVTSKAIEALAKKNAESGDNKTSLFGGYTSLTIPQLLENHLLIVDIPLDILNKEAYEGGDQLSKDYKTIINGLDFSNLSDGYYSVASVSFEVKNHQLEQFVNSMSSSPLSHPERKVGIFFFDNYVEWN